MFLATYFFGKSSTTWLGNVIAQSPRKMSLGSELFQRFIMVYRTIIGVNFHSFIICYDWCCHFPFFLKKLSVITALFGGMCRSASLVSRMVNTNFEAQKPDWDNIGLSCRLNRLNKHSRWEEWQDKVSFCSLIRFNWRVPARVPLFSLGLKVLRSPCGHSGRLSEVMLTHYRRRELRNSIYRYRKIHIDYRSKFSYRFVSFISIIYGNTNDIEYILCSLNKFLSFTRKYFNYLCNLSRHCKTNRSFDNCW